jgi:IS30 family transposase
VRKIATRIGRSPSTVSREVRRNLLAMIGTVMTVDLAHARARQRTGGSGKGS